MSLTLVDFFCGAGGSSQGAAAVPGVSIRLAANHWQRAIASHTANFPDTEHFKGDLHEEDVSRFPAGDLFWASPECTYWSNARGRRRDFDKQPDLFGETLPDEAADRSRALMWDVWLRRFQSDPPGRLHVDPLGDHVTASSGPASNHQRGERPDQRRGQIEPTSDLC